MAAAFCNKMDLATTSNLEFIKKNPLMIDVILDIVLEKLPIAQLKKCRFVNKQWNSRACHFLKKSWKNLKVIELDKNGKNVKFNKATNQAKDKGIFCNFNEILENYVEFTNPIFEIYPSKYLQLKLTQPREFKTRYRATKGVETRIEDILSILRASSKSLEQLDLITMYRTMPRKNIFNAQNEYNNVLFDFNLPKLEKIVLNFEPRYSNGKVEDYKAIFLLLEEIGKRAPKLKSLEITDICYSNNKTSNFLDYLKNSEILKKLENFGLIFDLTMNPGSQTLIGPKILMELVQQINGLTSLKLKLNFPEYKDKDYYESEIELLTQFFNGLAGKLKFLQLEIYQGKNFQIILPTFEKLEKFSIGYGIRGFSSYHKIPFVLNLSTKFPVLKEIDMVYNFQNWDLLFTGSSDTVEVLRIKSVIKGSKIQFKALERKFPNVRHFQTTEIKGLTENEGENPWEATLEVFTFIVDRFRILDFKLFRPYKALQRIEVLNRLPGEGEVTLNEKNRSIIGSNLRLRYDGLVSLLELKIKSFKIHQFLISEKVAAKIREKFILDYTLCAKVKKEKGEKYTQVQVPIQRRSQRFLEQKI